MKIIKMYMWPLVAGFVVASATMMSFEYINSLFYPFPEGMDTRNLEQVRAFARSMPGMAYIMVFLGWLFGGVFGTVTVFKIAKDRQLAKTIAMILCFLLTIAGIFNNLTFAAPIWFLILGILVFPASLYLAIKYFKL